MAFGFGGSRKKKPGYENRHLENFCYNSDLFSSK